MLLPRPCLFELQLIQLELRVPLRHRSAGSTLASGPGPPRRIRARVDHDRHHSPACSLGTSHRLAQTHGGLTQGHAVFVGHESEPHFVYSRVSSCRPAGTIVLVVAPAVIWRHSRLRTDRCGGERRTPALLLIGSIPVTRRANVVVPPVVSVIVIFALAEANGAVIQNGSGSTKSVSAELVGSLKRPDSRACVPPRTSAQPARPPSAALVIRLKVSPRESDACVCSEILTQLASLRVTSVRNVSHFAERCMVRLSA